MDQEPWDLAIIGAGPAGSVCACSALAADKGLRVALIDRDTFPRDKACGDAVRQDAVSVLEQLGLASVFEGRPRITRCTLNIPDNFQYLERIIDFDGYAYYVVERKIFDAALYEAAVQKGANDFSGHSMTAATYDESAELWSVTVKQSSGSEFVLRARVLVGADGAGSRVRRVAGLELNSEEYIAVAVRAYAQAPGFDEETMQIDYLERFMPGYGWVFPLLNGKVNIGMGLDKRDYKTAGSSLESLLHDYVRQLADEGVQIHGISDVKTYPLPLSFPELPLVPQQRVALIGDASAMIDPFTGEGIHFGIWSGYELGRAVSQGLNDDSLQSSMERFAADYAHQFGTVMHLSQQLRETLRFQRMFV